MKLYVIEHDRQQYALAEESDGTLHDVTQIVGGAYALSQTGLIWFIRQGEAAWYRLEKFIAEDRHPVDRHVLQEARLYAPILWPSKILCVGQNYADHCAEQGIEPPKQPLIFSKFPQCIVAPGDPICKPAVTERLDYEVELAVVLGRPARNVAPEEAMECVYGYTVANDITARDLQKSEGQWARAKGADTFCPLGPCLATRGGVPNPRGLRLHSWVNGEPRQDSDTGQMIFDVAELIAWCSRAMTLHPGDVLLTGTPPGVGQWRQPPGLLNPGDTVRVEVEGIGAMENPVVSEEEWLRTQRKYN